VLPEPGRTEAEPQSQRATEKPQAAAKDADADEVFEQSNAEAAQSFRRPQGGTGFSPDGRALTSGGASAIPGAGGGGSAQGTGGMGGMGGGISGAAVAAGDEPPDLAGGAGAGWTTAGGLSLDMVLPRDGQSLTFSKSGGDARLALGLRPRASLETGFGLAWTVVWLVIGLGLIAALARTDALAAIVHRLPPIVTAVRLVWELLLS